MHETKPLEQNKLVVFVCDDKTTFVVPLEEELDEDPEEELKVVGELSCPSWYKIFLFVEECKGIKLPMKIANTIKLITKNNLVFPFKELFNIKNIRLIKIVSVF